MATFADIVLNDGQATPSPKTFKVKLNDNAVSVWEQRDLGVPIGYATVRVQTKDTATVRKVTLSIAVPTLEAVSGANPSGFTPAPKVAYVHRVNVEFILPQRGSTQERKNIKAFCTNLLGNGTVTTIVNDGEEITG